MSDTIKKLIPRNAVKERLGQISDTTLWRMEKRGEIPPPVRLSRGRVMWIEAEINEMIDARAAARAA